MVCTCPHFHQSDSYFPRDLNQKLLDITADVALQRRYPFLRPKPYVVDALTHGSSCKLRVSTLRIVSHHLQALALDNRLRLREAVHI